MADTYHMVADFSFTDQSEIPVQHDVGGPVSVQVVIGAQTRPDLITEVELDDDQPSDRLTVKLSGAYSGRVQVFQVSMLPASQPTPEQVRATLDHVARGAGEIFDASTESGQLLGATAVDVEVAVQNVMTGDVFSRPEKTEVQFEAAGKITVVGGVTVQQTAGNGRTSTRCWLEHQPAAGAFGALPGSGSRIYTRSTSTGGRFASGSPRAALQVAVGDRVKLAAVRTEGTGTITTLADECNLVIQWLPV